MSKKSINGVCNNPFLIFVDDFQDPTVFLTRGGDRAFLHTSTIKHINISKYIRNICNEVIGKRLSSVLMAKEVYQF